MTRPLGRGFKGPVFWGTAVGSGIAGPVPALGGAVTPRARDRGREACSVTAQLGEGGGWGGVGGGVEGGGGVAEQGGRDGFGDQVLRAADADLALEGGAAVDGEDVGSVDSFDRVHSSP